jgi:hypothetical protein
MNDLRTVPVELLRQALEALENTTPTGWNMERDKQFFAAMNALRAALEQPAQEPVARVLQTVGQYHTGRFVAEVETVRRLRDGENLYTTPPRREWRGLTDEEMHGLYRRAGLEAYYPRDGVVQYEYERRFDAYARAIEAKLKEKNA